MTQQPSGDPQAANTALDTTTWRGTVVGIAAGPPGLRRDPKALQRCMTEQERDQSIMLRAWALSLRIGPATGLYISTAPLPSLGSEPRPCLEHVHMEAQLRAVEAVPSLAVGYADRCASTPRLRAASEQGRGSLNMPSDNDAPNQPPHLGMAHALQAHHGQRLLAAGVGPSPGDFGRKAEACGKAQRLPHRQSLHSDLDFWAFGQNGP